jgi:hypothetical protein
MTSLSITQAKPNPAGKDRLGTFVPSSQLASEWVDFKNTGNENYFLSGIKLHHVAYKLGYPNGVWEEVMGFKGTLGVGEVVRVHSGGEIPLSSLYPEDRVGANYHLFTGKNYVWNNSRSDSPRLVWQQNGETIELDKASYFANPPEGAILHRRGNSLL